MINNKQSNQSVSLRLMKDTLCEKCFVQWHNVIFPLQLSIGEIGR